MNIPLLTEKDVECRVSQVAETQSKKVVAGLLLYKNARVDMRILDEVYGPMGWQREHEVIDGNLYCTISVWDEAKKQWVKKQDVGVESNTEKEKGQASDAFKRAAFNVGVGRELYTAPRISVILNEGEYSVDGNRIKVKPFVKFFVKSIGYTEHEISSLKVIDNRGEIRFQWEG